MIRGRVMCHAAVVAVSDGMVATSIIRLLPAPCCPPSGASSEGSSARPSDRRASPRHRRQILASLATAGTLRVPR